VPLRRQAEPVVLALDDHAERSPRALEGLGAQVNILETSRPLLISSFIVTSTPLPRASLLAATLTALYRFSMPSADIAVPGRIEPTRTIGLSVRTTRLRK